MESDDESYAWSGASSSGDADSDDELKAHVKAECSVKQEQLADDSAEHYLERRIKEEKRVKKEERIKQQECATEAQRSDDDDSISHKHANFSKECVRESSSTSGDDMKQQNGSVRESSLENGHAHRESTTTAESKSRSNGSSAGAGLGRSKISDRIQYEDELEESMSEGPLRVEQEGDGDSKAVRRFMRTRAALRPAGDVMGVSNHEELWLVLLPRSVPARMLHDITLPLQSRCKVKLHQQHFEGRLQPLHPLTVLTHTNGHAHIQKCTVQGSIRLRHKVPKLHSIQDDTVGNQPEAIPLPVTKCRHPLFGADYKKAMKLPSSVRKRLKASKAAAAMRPAVEECVADEVDTTQTLPQHTRKRKRKKTLDNSAALEEEGVVAGTKRRKRDRHNTNQWDSVQHIEHNLFNVN